MKRRNFLQALAAIGIAPVVSRYNTSEASTSEVTRLDDPPIIPKDDKVVFELDGRELQKVIKDEISCQLLYKGRKIAEGTEISGPTMSREVIDVTSDHGMGYSTFVGGRQETTIIMVIVSFDSYKLKQAYMDDDTPVEIKIKCDNTCIEAEAWITEMQITPSENGELTLKLQGAANVI